MNIGVILVDDHLLVRNALAVLLRQYPDVRVLGEASNGREAITMTAALAPDVVIMDLGMPELGGSEATRQIIEAHPNVRVLVLSAYTDRTHILSALRAGAGGYLVKDCAADELITALETVAAGQRYVSPSLSHTVIADFVASGVQSHRDALTPREREVLQLLAEGKAMKEVAVVLRISTKTVESHRRAVMEKLQLFSTAELTKHAVREGLTTLD